jgi:predicted TIM-barrel fold metal-dependent hydrolase
MICDAHVHFFSPGFFDGLGRQLGLPETGRAAAVVTRTGWQDPESPEALADRWVAELDRHDVSRAALIASLPGDEPSVGTATLRHPSRFIGFFMLDPTREDSVTRTRSALETGLRGICLFPAMHRYALTDERVTRVLDAAAGHAARPVIFVHCGMLSVGVRRKLGLPSPFDMRLGQPLDVAMLAARFPAVPFIIPHFGAGLFREALMAADLSPNIYLDTSSSNSWMRYTPGLTLADVFRSALSVTGPDRLLFGTDSSFFPRGWNHEVLEDQQAAMQAAGVSEEVRAKVLGGNFVRLFPGGD